jgi:CDP-diacylglycerol--serine O-phosphatidyltransferase
MAIRRQDSLAAWLILGAAFIDAIDGRTAKLLEATSEIGAQLDAMSDVLTFCVAPAVLLYQQFFPNWGIQGIAISSLLIVSGTFRLARFQSQHCGEREYFAGLPTPAATGLMAGFAAFSHEVGSDASFSLVAAVLVVCGSLLMVSSIPYESDLFIEPGRILKHWKGLVFILFVASLFPFRGGAFFGWACVYVAFGLLRSLVTHLKRWPKSLVAETSN